jgi:ankyrin repeat protein
MTYYKITNKTETHHGLKYKTGLNVDPLPFNPRGDCTPGGIYYTDAENILYFLDYGPWIREVILPKDAQVYQNHGLPKKWKADKVKLGPRHKWCSLEIIKKLIKEGADIHIDDDYVLRLAAESGHLDVVKYLIKNGADIHARDDYALGWAVSNDYLDVVKYLIKNGADIHARDDCALRYAASNGHLSVVKYLVEKGADIHAVDDWAFQWAAIRGHMDIVEFLSTVSENARLGWR